MLSSASFSLKCHYRTNRALELLRWHLHVEIRRSKSSLEIIEVQSACPDAMIVYNYYKLGNGGLMLDKYARRNSARTNSGRGLSGSETEHLTGTRVYRWHGVRAKPFSTFLFLLFLFRLDLVAFALARFLRHIRDTPMGLEGENSPQSGSQKSFGFFFFWNCQGLSQTPRCNTVSANIARSLDDTAAEWDSRRRAAPIWRAILKSWAGF